MPKKTLEEEINAFLEIWGSEEMMELNAPDPIFCKQCKKCIYYESETPVKIYPYDQFYCYCEKNYRSEE
jgi:hypothetical protein